MKTDQNEKSEMSALTSHILTSLHSILKPFLLRRLKVDVECSLPPKKEYILYAPVTEQQKVLYEAVLDGRVREWLISRVTGESIGEIASKEEEARAVAENGSDEEAQSRRPNRRKKAINYKIDDDDDAYLQKLEEGADSEGQSKSKALATNELTDIGREYVLQQART